MNPELLRIMLKVLSLLWLLLPFTSGKVTISNGHSYFFTKNSLNYLDAKSFCAENSMVLASMENETLFDGFMEMVTKREDSKFLFRFDLVEYICLMKDS